MSTENREPKHRVAEREFQNSKSEYWLPNDFRNRKSETEYDRELDSPPYRVNADSVCFSDSLAGRPFSNDIEVTEYLVDKTSNPKFHLEYPCRGCEEWKPVDIQRPRRRGAVDPCTSCFGCWYGHLDGGDERFSEFDRDAAANWWAKIKARQHKLRTRLSDSKSEREKKKIQKALKWSQSEEMRALRACHVLGFDPRNRKKSKPNKQEPEKFSFSPPVESIKEAQGYAVDDLRHDQVALAMTHTKTTNCGNCVAWSFDETISTDDKKMGFCWARDGDKTREEYWCPSHKYSG